MTHKRKLNDQENEENQVRKKLENIMRSLLHYISLGSSNKIDDLRRTNGWSIANCFRYGIDGEYKKAKVYSADNICDKSPNYEFNHDQSDLIVDTKKHWFFRNPALNTNFPKQVKLLPRIEKIDPLNDGKFKLTDSHVNLLKQALLTREARQAVCLNYSCLYAKMLWEVADSTIQKIEMVHFVEVDHVFLIINREGGLNDMESGWVVDPWCGPHGLIFPAREYKERLPEMLSFLNEQLKELQRINVNMHKTPFDIKKIPRLLFKCDAIMPDKHLYPTYSHQPFYPLEYYYLVENAYPNNTLKTMKKDLEDHKEKFIVCRKEMKFAPCHKEMQSHTLFLKTHLQDHKEKFASSLEEIKRNKKSL